MKQLSEATPISRKDFIYPKSEDFLVKLKFPQVFTFFEFQLVKLFLFFHTC